MEEHRCKESDLELTDDEPTLDEGTVSYKVKCKVCGKIYEEVYTRVDGWFDPDINNYTYL